MKGKILDFSVENGSGIISAEDGNRYSFNVSEWKGSGNPTVNQTVDFMVNGDNATGIYLDFNSDSKGDPNTPLWNPSAIVNWSFLFSPIFGAFLMSKNWKAMGDEKRAKTSMIWMVFGIIIPAVTMGAGLFPYYLIWYFVSAKSQISYIKEHYGTNYKKQSFVKPVLISACILAIPVVAVSLLS